MPYVQCLNEQVETCQNILLAEGTMEYSQLFVFVLLIPVVLQILLPLAILAGFCLLRLLAMLFSPIRQKAEQLTGRDAAVA